MNGYSSSRAVKGGEKTIALLLLVIKNFFLTMLKLVRSLKSIWEAILWVAPSSKTRLEEE